MIRPPRFRRRRGVRAIVAIAVLAACRPADPQASPPTVADADVVAPSAPGGIPFADTLHGVVIADSLRWMEDTTRREMQAWLRAESTYTAEVLARLVGRDSLSARVDRVMTTLPTLDQLRDTPSRLLLTRWFGRSPSLVAVDSGTTRERMLLSDTALARLRNGAALRAMSPSWDGRYVAIGTTERGDVNAGISVLDARTGQLLPDRVPDLLTTTSGTRYEVTWLPDHSGFIYPRLWPGSDKAAATEALARGRQFVHRLGTPQSADVPIFGFGVDGSPVLDKDDLPTRVLTAPGSTWLVGSVFRVRQNGSEWYVSQVPLRPGMPWVQITTKDDLVSAPQLIGDTLYALRRRDADRGTIVRRVLSSAGAGHGGWEVVVPERRGVITNFSVQSDGVYFTERDSGAVVLRHLAPGSVSPRPVVLPVDGTVTLLRRRHTQAGAVVNVETWATPPRWLRVRDGRAAPLGIDDGVEAGGDARLVSVRLEVPSTGGARVPVSLVFDREAMGARDGHAPLLIEAYGAYAQSTDPGFRPHVQAWTMHGGVYAYVHARGGGEKGEAWHRAAVRAEKQRTVDDVIAAIEALIAERYTSAGRVVVTGTSSGAMIPGLVAVQRPELLGAALFEVGQPDEVRGAQLDPTSARNIAELGDMDTAEGIGLLLRWSPYHQVPQAARLPAMLIHTASGDYNFGGEMVVAKYVARLQAATRSGRPIVWVRTDGGHGELFYKSPSWAATVMSFALWQSGDARYQPKRTSR